MKRVATLFALLLSASAASAYTYQIDNGNYADSWTFTNGNTTWANHFTAVSGNNVIDKVLIAFGDNSNQNMNGQSVTIKLWNDPNGDGNPSDAVLLTSYLGTVANAGTTLFNEFDIANCEFRYKLDSDSSRSWTVIPRQAGHRFQRNLDSPKS